MQGNVYQQIIDNVIKASQNDFEESGVDPSTLEEMKQVRDSLVGYPAIAPSLQSWQQHSWVHTLIALLSSSLSSISLFGRLRCVRRWRDAAWLWW
jgi:hypothetical protein